LSVGFCPLPFGISAGFMNENVFSLLVCGWGMLPLRQSREKKTSEKTKQKWHGQSACPWRFLDVAYAK